MDREIKYIPIIRPWNVCTNLYQYRSLLQWRVVFLPVMKPHVPGTGRIGHRVWKAFWTHSYTTQIPQSVDTNYTSCLNSNTTKEICRNYWPWNLIDALNMLRSCQYKSGVPGYRRSRRHAAASWLIWTTRTLKRQSIPIPYHHFVIKLCDALWRKTASYK